VPDAALMADAAVSTALHHRQSLFPDSFRVLKLQARQSKYRERNARFHNDKGYGRRLLGTKASNRAQSRKKKNRAAKPQPAKTPVLQEFGSSPDCKAVAGAKMVTIPLTKHFKLLGKYKDGNMEYLYLRLGNPTECSKARARSCKSPWECAILRVREGIAKKRDLALVRDLTKWFGGDAKKPPRSLTRSCRGPLECGSLRVRATARDLALAQDLIKWFGGDAKQILKKVPQNGCILMDKRSKYCGSKNPWCKNRYCSKPCPASLSVRDRTHGFPKDIGKAGQCFAKCRAIPWHTMTRSQQTSSVGTLLATNQCRTARALGCKTPNGKLAFMDFMTGAWRTCYCPKGDCETAKYPAYYAF